MLRRYSTFLVFYLNTFRQGRSLLILVLACRLVVTWTKTSQQLMPRLRLYLLPFFVYWFSELESSISNANSLAEEKKILSTITELKKSKTIAKEYDIKLRASKGQSSRHTKTVLQVIGIKLCILKKVRTLRTKSSMLVCNSTPL